MKKFVFLLLTLIFVFGLIWMSRQRSEERAQHTPRATSGASELAEEGHGAMHAAALPAENDAERIANFLTIQDAMATALAADDLDAFNAASRPTMGTTEAFVEAARKLLGQQQGADHPVAEELWVTMLRARHLHGFDDLTIAREEFLTFSNAATAVLEALQKSDSLPEFVIFSTSLADSGLSQAPEIGRWIQTGTRPEANPFRTAPQPETP